MLYWSLFHDHVSSVMTVGFTTKPLTGMRVEVRKERLREIYLRFPRLVGWRRRQLIGKMMVQSLHRTTWQQ